MSFLSFTHLQPVVIETVRLKEASLAKRGIPRKSISLSGNSVVAELLKK